LQIKGNLEKSSQTPSNTHATSNEAAPLDKGVVLDAVEAANFTDRYETRGLRRRIQNAESARQEPVPLLNGTVITRQSLDIKYRMERARKNLWQNPFRYGQSHFHGKT